jgi:hypothetical protein
MRSFIKSNLDVIGGGVAFAILGLFGFQFKSPVLWGVSLLGVFIVSLQRVARALKANAQLDADFNLIVGCFRKCIVRKAPGMEIEDATITYRIDPVRNRDIQERRYVIHAGDYGAKAKHVYIGSHRDGSEYGQGFKASLVRTLQLKAEDVTPFPAGDKRKHLNVCAVPYTIDNKSLYVALGFEPRMAPDETREIRLSVLRRGLWDKLRATGCDEDCSYKTSEIPTKRLRIQVMLEGNAIALEHGELRIIPSNSSEDDLTAESRYSDAAARTVSIWDIPDPRPNTVYRYGVECDPLKPKDIPWRVKLRKEWRRLMRKGP